MSLYLTGLVVGIGLGLMIGAVWLLIFMAYSD